MSSFRDTLIPCVDAGRKIVEDLGLRPYLVRTVKRTWGGPKKGQGTPVDVVTVFDPQPKVSEPSPRRVYDSPGRYKDGDRIVTKISALLTEDDLDGGELGPLEEFFWLVDDQAYRLAREPQVKNFEFICHLRRVNRKDFVPVPP